MSSGSTGMEQPVHDDLAAARLAWAQWRSVSMDSAFAAVMGDALPTSLEAIRVDLPGRLRADPTFMNAVAPRSTTRRPLCNFTPDGSGSSLGEYARQHYATARATRSKAKDPHATRLYIVNELCKFNYPNWPHCKLFCNWTNCALVKELLYPIGDIIVPL